MAQRDLLVRIIGDNKSILRAFAGTSRGAKQFDRDMGRVTRGALAGSGALGGLGRSLAFASGGFISGAAAVGLVVRAFQELNESRKVTAQTNAVIKSTGEIAGVTAKHVDALGQALLRQTGIDDEAIRSAENLLLTFTNVRNVIGDGNDVFDQATTAILNMSVAMGEDLESATVRVGKALQDPVKGVTALRRVGVLLTESQQRQIKALVQTGRVMDAQKIILRELTREFGGSARAAGDVQPWNLLRETILNLSAVLAEKFLPKIQEAAARLQTWLDNPANTKKVEEDATSVANAVGGAVDAFLEFREKGNKAMEDLRRGTSIAAEATRAGILGPLGTLGGPIGEWATKEKEESLRELEALRRGARTIAVNMRLELEEALQLKNRGPVAPEGTANAPGTAGRTGLTATQRNRFFDSALARSLDRVQDADLRAQVAKLDKIAATITARIAVTKDITRKLNLEDQLVQVGRQRKSALEQIADNAKAAAEDAKQTAQDALDAAKEAAQKLVEARNARQFFTLGLSPTGGVRTPGLPNLRKQLGSLTQAVEGTFLDTTKTQSLMNRIRKVLSGGFGKVSEDVRATIRDMLQDIRDQLKQADRTLTKGRALNVNSVLQGLGLSPDETRALRARLSHVGAGGKVLGGPRSGALGFAVAGGGTTVVHTTITLDGDVVSRAVSNHQTIRARRIATQTTGPHAGNASGTNR